MSTTRLNLTIPTQLDEYAQQRVSSGAFATKSDYVRHLIRQDQEAQKQSEIQLLNKMIQEGIDSDPSEKTSEEILEGVRQIVSATKKKTGT